MFLLAMGLAAFLGSFIQSRRVTEASVLHAAASSLVYGLIEQMKGLEYGTLPTHDPDAPANPPLIRLRVTPEEFVELKVVHTPAPGTPAAPLTTPVPTANAASLGAIDNTVGPLDLSSTGSSHSQKLQVNFWIWVDEIPDASTDVKEVKKITVVYTYKYNDGNRERTVRDREVFLRTRFDQ